MSQESQDFFPPSQAMSDRALIKADDYHRLYQQSLAEPHSFWQEQGQRLHWFQPFTQVKDAQFTPNQVQIRWFQDGTLNVAYNCIDRHLAERADQTALIFEGDEPSDECIHISYRALHRQVCRLANVLKAQGVHKGDRVTIYMPMIPEAAYAMLACARIGAVHSVVFGGFSPDALAGRIQDCKSSFVITADEGVRGGKRVPLKQNVDQALRLAGTDGVKTVLVVRRTGSDIEWNAKRDLWYHQAMETVSEDCPAEVMNAEDPLFILYTSGSTGKPKGVLHTTGGYLVYVSLTHQWVFDYQDGDVYWCAADVGWITGHSYMIYGPLANGAQTLLFEGIPTYPSVKRLAEVIAKHQVNTLYMAPTAIRTLMAHGDDATHGIDLSSLRLLGSVGEPINPEAWHWYREHYGQGAAPILDTWWQTETGGLMITPLPGVTSLKPGSATRPFFGIEPALLDKNGQELEGVAEGDLVIKASWPGQMRTVYGDPERFIQTYFSTYPGYYCTGDGARRDEDGYYWITGRVDDVLNVSGHRLGTAEIESALVAHSAVAEAAVVGRPHAIKGESLYVFVTLMQGTKATDELRQELVAWVRQQIGPLATPDCIQWASGLPKTRSGKIMRRILRNIAAGAQDNLGDTSTLADPSVIEHLIEQRQKLATE